MAPSHSYRNWLRSGVRMLMEPQHEALLFDAKVNDLGMNDLEALFELVFGFKPLSRAPDGYFPKPNARR
jgi:hypothetical protein